MKKLRKLLIGVLGLLAGGVGFAQTLNQVKESQLTSVSPFPSYTDQFVTPTSTNQVWGFNAAGQVVTYQLSTGFTVTGSYPNYTLTAAGGGGGLTGFTVGNLSPLFTGSNSGTLTFPVVTFTASTAAQNSVLAGPSSGGTGAYSFRALVAADIPALSYQPLATNLTSLAGLSYASLAFVKMSASGTFSLDTSTYLTAAGAVTSITGTANQITASASTGAVTLSLPTTLASIATLENVAGTTLTLDSLTHTAAITGVTVSGTFTGASANQVGVQIAPTVNQTGTSAFTLLDLVSTNTALGTGAQYLINARVGGNQIFTLGNATYGAPVTGTGFIITLPSQTFTATGTTGVANVGQVYLAGSTLTNASTNTITNLATLMIAAAPSVAGSQVGTNKYALDVLAGASLFNGTINNITVTAPASASTLTIASGGSFITTGAFSLTLTATNTTVATFPTGTITLAQLGAQTFSGAQTFGAGVLASGAIANDFSGSSGTFNTSTGAVTIGNGAVSITGATTLSNTFTLNGTATATALTVAQTAQTSGVAPAMQITVGASTGITAATVAPVLQTVTATRTWATTGTVADQYEYLFVADTLASASASQTFTVASTVDISGPPIQGSNAILSNPLALDVEAGPSSFGGTAYTFSTNPAVTGATAIIVPAATTTFQTSPPATVSAVYLGIPTLADAAVSQTIATAATLTINGAPAPGTNITITNPWAINVVAGATNLQAATINGAATFSSTLTVSGSGAVNLGSGTTTASAVTSLSNGTYLASSTDPSYRWFQSNGALNQKYMDAEVSPLGFRIRSFPDALTGLTPLFTVDWSANVKIPGTSSLSGNVGINSTPGTSNLTVAGNATTYAVDIAGNASTGHSNGIFLNAGTNTSDFALNISNQAQTLSYLAVRGDGLVTASQSFTSSGTTTLTGNVTVGATSTSGTTLNSITLNGESGHSSYGPYFQISDGAGFVGLIGSQNALVSGTTSNLTLSAGNAMTIYTNNNAGIALALTLDASQNATFAGQVISHDSTLHRTLTTLTNGAGSSAGTLANAPSVGNPTKWVPINDNGTTRYIPAW